MNFKISVEDDIALLEINGRCYDLSQLSELLIKHDNFKRKAYNLFLTYRIGQPGEYVVEHCLNELERRLYAESKMLNGI